MEIHHAQLQAEANKANMLRSLERAQLLGLTLRTPKAPSRFARFFHERNRPAERAFGAHSDPRAQSRPPA